MAKQVIFFLLMASSVFSQRSEGDSCTDEYTNSLGRCTPANNCRSAKENLDKNGIWPTFCSYNFNGGLVCCRDGGNILQRPATQTADGRPIWGTVDSTDRRRVSERKCDEYSRGVVKRVDFISLVPDPETMSVTSPKCDYTGVQLIVGGEKASLGEFPHMAAIGWTDFDGGYSFKCGGSLISPRFVLTAGHCTNDPRAQNPFPVVVRLGDLNIDPSVNDGARPIEVAIRNIRQHPEYNSPKRYNDIALLELATDVNFVANVRPACLWTQQGVGNHQKAVATGWGAVDAISQRLSKDLLKVSLSLLENSYCDPLLSDTHNRNWWGFAESQLCAGELRGGKDTCQGDSGSPLQVTSTENQCIFRVIGITSFGRKCAETGRPSVYTRVSSYLNWIESVVWPGE